MRTLPCLGASLLWLLTATPVLPTPAAAQSSYRPTPQLTDLMGLRFFPKLGLFQFDGLQLVFPKPGAYRLVLRAAGGGVVYQTDLRLEGVSGFPAFGWLAPLERGSDKFKITESGRYELAVRLDEQDLAVLAFDAKATDSGDPFNPGRLIRLSGPWDQHAFFYSTDGDPNAKLYAVGWVIDDEFGPTRDDRWVTVQIVRGTQVLCLSNVAIDAPHWARYRFDPYRPGSNGQCTLADIVKTDGAYRLEFRSKSRLLRTFGFTVAGGKIQRIPANTAEYLTANWGGIPAKLVNSDLQLQEIFWLARAR